MAPPYACDDVVCDKGARRRQKSREAARCRRQVESDIFNDICSSIPVPPKILSQVDRSTTLRLVISFLKLREAMATVKFEPQGVKSEVPYTVPDDEEYVNALNGFILILSQDFDVMYASNNINEYIGMKSLDMIGHNLFDYTHEGDHSELTKGLKSSSADSGHRNSLFLRIKSTLMSSGRSVAIKSAKYKVVKCESVTHHCTEPSGTFTVMHCEPVPHPSNIETVIDCKTYLSQHTLDMKFTYCDSERSRELTGYSKEDVVEHSFFDFCHTADVRTLENSMQKLLKLGQVSTPAYRMLARSGGYVWVVTEATVILNDRNHHPSYIVCVNHVLSEVMEPGLILSVNQLECVEKSASLLLEDEIELLSDPEILPELHMKDSTDDIFHDITDLVFDEFKENSFSNMTDDIFDSEVMPSGELTEDLAQNAPSIGDEFDFSQINFTELFGIDVVDGSGDPSPINNFPQVQTTIAQDVNASVAQNNFVCNDFCLATGENGNDLTVPNQAENQNLKTSSCYQGINITEPSHPLRFASTYQIFAVPRSHFNQVQESSLLKRKMPSDCGNNLHGDSCKQAKLADQFVSNPESSFASASIPDEEKLNGKATGEAKLPENLFVEASRDIPCSLSVCEDNTQALMEQPVQNNSTIDYLADIDWFTLPVTV